MLREHIYRRGAWWWRCYNCGERVDGAILRARAEQEADAAFLRDSEDIELKAWAEWLRKIPGARDGVMGGDRAAAYFPK